MKLIKIISIALSLTAIAVSIYQFTLEFDTKDEINVTETTYKEGTLQIIDPYQVQKRVQEEKDRIFDIGNNIKVTSQGCSDNFVPSIGFDFESNHYKIGMKHILRANLSLSSTYKPSRVCLSDVDCDVRDMHNETIIRYEKQWINLTNFNARSAYYDNGSMMILDCKDLISSGTFTDYWEPSCSFNVSDLVYLVQGKIRFKRSCLETIISGNYVISCYGWNKITIVKQKSVIEATLEIGSELELTNTQVFKEIPQFYIGKMKYEQGANKYSYSINGVMYKTGDVTLANPYTVEYDGLKLFCTQLVGLYTKEIDFDTTPIGLYKTVEINQVSDLWKVMVAIAVCINSMISLVSIIEPFWEEKQLSMSKLTKANMSESRVELTKDINSGNDFKI